MHIEPAAGHAMARPFVGRAAELAELRGALEAAARGHGRAFLIAGEPGIGKTRLCDRLANEATGLGMHVLWGRCWEAGGAPAYWPWLEVLQSLAATLSDKELNVALGDGAAALAELVPAVRERTPVLAAGEPLRSGDEARFRLYRAVLALLRAGARDAGALIVIDDLHAADEASLQLLRFVAREARGLAVMVLATYRDVDGRWTASGERALSQLSREAVTLQLDRLSHGEAEQLIDSQARDVEPVVRAKLAARAGGHPLFLEELVRSVSRDPLGGALPGNVRELIRERLGRVTADVRAVLELAAVAGDTVDPELIAPASHGGGAHVLATLETAREAGIVRMQGPGTFRFAHELIREALIRDLTAAQRAVLHAQVARAIAARPQAERSEAELAHHFMHAGELARAARHAERAAERASALFAYEEAVQVLERVLAAIEARADVHGGDELAEPRAALQIALARVHMRRGDYPAGRALCERAAAAARDRHDAELLARAALARGLDITAALIDHDLVAMLKSALAALPEVDAPLRVNVQARLAAAMQPHPNLLYPIGLARDAIAAARRLGDPETLLNALYFGMAAMMDIVDPAERIPLNLEVERLAGQAGDRDRLLRTQIRLAFDHMELGELAAADARIDAFEQLAAEAGARRYIWRVPLLRSMRAMMHGHFEECEMHIERARVLGEAASDPQTERGLIIHTEGLLRAAERHDAMIAFDPQARRARAAFYSGAHWQNGGSAFTYSRIEDVASTERYLRQVPQDDWPIVHNPPGFAHLGEPLAMCGERRAVEHVYRLLSPAAERFISWGWTGTVWDGPASRVLGLLAARLERWDEAEAHFTAALASLEKLEARPYLARTSYEHGRFLLAHDAGRARAAIERAHALAEQLGMPGLVRLCDQRSGTLAEAKLARAPASVRPAPRVCELTRDGEVWTLAFEGQTLHLRDSLGVQYLARLLAAPGQPIHALELAQGKLAPDAELASALQASDAGEELDATARNRYRQRVNALRDELADAEAAHDVERAERVRAELTFVAAELSRAVGISGRIRRAGSAAERARTAVQRRIKSTLERVAEASPRLASMLEKTVKTGTYCEYRPELAGAS